MQHLSDCISSQVKMPNSSLERILSAFQVRKLEKGEYLLKAGNICREMAFIDSGYLRMFSIVDGKEVTFWVGSSGKFITSLSSFVFETSNFWNIQAITESTVYSIGKTAHKSLCESEPKWLEFDNLLLAHSFAILERSMFSQLHTTAKERFDALMKEEPHLFHHVPLQYIASMIGIAPESLSRLRKNSLDLLS